ARARQWRPSLSASLLVTPSDPIVNCPAGWRRNRLCPGNEITIAGQPAAGCGSGTLAQMEARQRRLESIDVSDPRLYQDDNWGPLFGRLRRDDPVHYFEASPFGPYWSVTRYDDIFTVELDHENYSSSSELGGIQIADQPKGQEIAN